MLQVTCALLLLDTLIAASFELGRLLLRSWLTSCDILILLNRLLLVNNKIVSDIADVEVAVRPLDLVIATVGTILTSSKLRCLTLGIIPQDGVTLLFALFQRLFRRLKECFGLNFLG